MMDTEHTDSDSYNGSVEKYYRFHSLIYDATRWSFLFGRDDLLDGIPDLSSKPRILEIGCGTGKNLSRLQYYFPDADLVGIDLSSAMLEVAKNKFIDSNQVKLIQAEYGADDIQLEPFDLIICSYSLTMVGDNIEDVIVQITDGLNPHGYIAVVDFNTSPFGWFRQWMEVNHVDLSGHLLPLLNKYYRPVISEKNDAYWGLWSYFTFIGQHS
ncbi:S-adenosylmethionine-diacylgycerolhomoserine-N-methyltransferase [Fodinibius salinus]|uniref:S-adenosylmethionine-diacylgycerolhomoserine-N-methyltransferase n=1 Tax=Fodinibius salinus TaxID=860790 RepID=A0A5D3YNL7_9BACT|nr:class I SAM-dependent methyltransferase [Fodinibius salinus]TYP95464.1 S-adenosylmethionine-diacylgycerolhomoserine-N-methyltransferase [Fodinibius salinus]